MIIEGNFDPQFMTKLNFKEILEDEKIIKADRYEMMRDENITFNSGIEEEKETKEDEDYRWKYEEALIWFEDQEDVLAYQNAKREMDDEFDQGDLSPREDIDMFDEDPTKKEAAKEKTFLSEHKRS